MKFAFKKLFLSIFLFVFLANCQQNQDKIEEKGRTSAQIDSLRTEKKAVEHGFDFGEYENLQFSESCLIVMRSSGASATKSSIRSEYDGSSKDYSYNSVWNFVFYNLKTQKFQAITNSELIFMEYLHTSEQIGKLAKECIFYIAFDDQLNKDSIFDEMDNKRLYVSDRNGLNFQALSPENTHLQYWAVADSNRKLLVMKVIEDTNKNKKLGESDWSAWYEVKIDSPQAIRKIFEPAFLQKLRNDFAKRTSVQRKNEEK